MKHGRHFRKLGKDASHRWAMIRTMVTQLIEHERIQTTVAKAKELRRVPRMRSIESSPSPPVVGILGGQPSRAWSQGRGGGAHRRFH